MPDDLPGSGTGWVRVAARPSSAARAGAVSAALFDAGAQGVHEDGDWLITHCATRAEAAAIEQAARGADADGVVEQTDVPAVDWTVGWREGIRAHTVGRLTVTPPWLASAYRDADSIVIDPAMAFGTGDHPTTRGVLHLMQDVVRPGDTVADLGSGSAVLAIAAVRLGARRVAAIELDPDAIGNAEENVLRNGVSAYVTVLCGDAEVLLPLVAPVRVVFANIISSVIVELLPTIGRSLTGDGVAILSGMLTVERPMMLTHLQRHGWRVRADLEEGDWWSVCISSA